MGNHAKLSPSAAERWINCPGSFHLSTYFPETSSPQAQEGTLAHELAEILIAHRVENQDKKIAKHKEKVDAFYQLHPELTESYAGMRKYIEPYVDYVWAEFTKIQERDPAAFLTTERKVDFSDIVPEGFGTSDVVIIGDNQIEVIDLKYGKGVEVFAKDNPQIRLYAIGAVNEFSLVYDFEDAKMVIYQPRRDHVTEDHMAVADLLAWGRETVAPAAAEALSEHPSYHPGAWCDSHFCPAAGACKARAQYALGIARHSGKDPALLTDEEISDALGRIAELTKWSKKLETYALNEAQDGHAIPGWKIVEGKTNRTYADADKVAAAVMKAGYEEALIYTRSLIGITDMEKLLGKKNFANILGDLVIKPVGAPKLAPETDDRPAFNPKQSMRDSFDD